MHKVQLTSNPISSQLFNTYMYRVLALIIAIAMILISNSTLAAVTCDVGFVPDEFSVTDYGHLGSNASPPVLGINQLLDGIKNESYIVASNSLNTVATGTLETRGSNFYRPKTLTGGVESFELFQDFTDKAGTRTVSYTFNNNFTEKPQALKNVSLSIYDIDANYARTGIFTGTRYFEFSDQVTITGVTSSGETVNPILKFRGSEITSSTPYRQITDTNSVLCNTDSLDTKCKVSVAFENDDVVKIDVTYGNNPDLEYYGNNNYFNPGDQLINIVFDGYCYKPQPRLTYRKELSDPRKSSTDQFTVQIKDNVDNSVVTNDITTTTTTGIGNTVTNGTGTTGTFKINPTKTYKLTEAASGTTTLSNYIPIYACKKSGLNGATITTLNPNSLQLTYGDDWTCTVTNGRPNYNFSGFVFNDNGGIPSIESTRRDFTSTFTGNTNYFNGIFDSSGSNTESGIGASGLQVRLTNCGPNGGTNIAGTTAQNIPASATSGLSLGQYKFTVPASVIATLSPQKVCVLQVEPSSWKDGTNVSDYSVDTTPNIREVNLVTNTFNYKTESDGSRNLDFGEVQYNNTSLVLIKSQYVHNCNINSSYNGTSNTPSQTPVFSIDPINNIEPGKCIAYKIEAYNRGHVDLTNIQITDKLQTTPVKSVFISPFPLGNPMAINNNGTTLPVDTIISNVFSLVKPSTGATPTKATLYFNTKYGSTVNAQ